MAYVSLYRRYRPQTFADVVGQEHVTRTLVNAIAEGRLHHAYLFAGPRGTGKTSTARILAKAVNCDEGPTPDPCNRCANCVGITDGSSMDVIELDMASHGGVDDARELRDRALFAPARARRKVYILDEVHMASTAAFNALLKLVEEPPAHVLFAMATTDPQKVLPTILSRVQRLDLRRVDAQTLAEQVRRVCDAEGFAIESDALDTVVRAGDGSVRDTLSVLEQILSFADGTVTATMVTDVLGHSPADRVFEIVDRLSDGDLGGLLAAVQGLVDEGHDLRRFTLDLAQHVRDLLVLRVAPDRPGLVDATEERRGRLAAQAARMDTRKLLDIVGMLGDTVAEQRMGAPRLPLELALARLTVPASRTPASSTAQEAPDAHGPADREPAVETSGDAGDGPDAPSDAGDGPDAHSDAGDGPDVPTSGDATGAPDPPDAAADASDPPDAEAVHTSADSDELAAVTARWADVLETVKQQSRRCHALFEPAKPVRAGRGVLTLRYGRRYASFHAQNARKAEFADVLRAAVRSCCDVDVRLEIVIEGEDDRRRPRPASVTPEDARTPVLEDRAGGGSGSGEHSAEETDVREAEMAPADPGVSEVGELLASELGAELVEERPATRE